MKRNGSDLSNRHRAGTIGLSKVFLALGTALLGFLGLGGLDRSSESPGQGTLATAALLPPPGDTSYDLGPISRNGASGAGNTYIDRIVIPTTPGRLYQLRIVNGPTHVTSAVTKWNGKQIIGPSDFTSSTTQINLVVAATLIDTLRMTLVGPAGSSVTVSVFSVPDPTYNIFGENTYNIPSGTSKVYEPSFSRPAAAAPTFRMYVINGDSAGGHRVSTAEIKLNGTVIFSTSEITNAIGSAVKAVTVPSGNNTMRIALTGPAGKYLRLRITATDTTPPVLTFVAPPHDSFATNDSNYNVNGTVVDETPVVGVTVNGLQADLDAAEWSQWLLFPSEGWHQVRVVARNAAGDSTVAIRQVLRDTEGPVMTVLPADSTYTRACSVNSVVVWTDLEASDFWTNGFHLEGTGNTRSLTIPLQYGENLLSTLGNDALGNQNVVLRSVFRDTLAPTLVVLTPANNATVGTATVVVSGTVTDASPVSVTVNGVNAQVTAGAFSATIALSVGANPIATVATDRAGNSSTDNRTVNRGQGLPPDPVTVATTVNRAEVTTIADNTSFLYSGPSAIQTGMVPGTINPVRAAVARGRVLDRTFQPLGGVQVRVLVDTSYGATQSRADGAYDFAVNGGTEITLSYSKSGYLPATRTVEVKWQDYTNIDDVILLQPDTAATVVPLAAAAPPVARATVTTDADGPRQATVIVKPGNSATLHLPDGTTHSLDTLTIRQTEFTVGDSGLMAMPAPLPPASQYTYAVQLTADEALAAGPGAEVTLAQPIPLYVENFLGFPVGTPIPIGRLDPATGGWVPEPNGVVLKVVGKDVNGRAQLDITGDGIADPPNALLLLGIDNYELDQLGATYPAGADLWRALVRRLAVYDENLPYIQVGTEPTDGKVKAGCGSREGDPLRCQLQMQTAFQSVGVVGSPFTLNYASDRTQGNKADRTLEITLTGATLPAQLQRVELEIDVAGRRIRGSFPTPTPNMTYTFLWDGKDAYDRVVQGSVPATVLIGYVFPVFYAVPANSPVAFGLPCLPPSGSSLSCALQNDAQTGPRTEQVLAQAIETTIGGLDAAALGMGGFTLSAQQVYDPIGQVLYKGDGTRRATAALPASISTVAGNGLNDPFSNGVINSGIPATSEKVSTPLGLAVAPDGSFYVTDRSYIIRKITPDGVIHTIMGDRVAQGGYSGDGHHADSAQILNPQSLALGPDGSLYIADANNQRIRRIDPSGIITTVAGTGVGGFAGDSGPAINARLSNPTGVDVAPDGTIYIADQNNHRIRRVAPDGIITTIAGDGLTCSLGAFGPESQFISLCGTNIPATTAHFGNGMLDLRLGPDGSVYVVDNGTNRVRRIGNDGIIRTVAGSNNTPLGDGGPATLAAIQFPERIAIARDGTLYISQFESNSAATTFRIRKVAPNGIITTFAGTGAWGYSGDGGPAAAAQVRGADGLAIGPDGSLYLADRNNHRVRRIRGVLPGFGAGQTVLASEDGRELYVFSSAGRILLTLNATTLDTVLSFSYDAGRRLTGVRDASGRVTTIVRNQGGDVTGITPPDGNSTTVAISVAGVDITSPNGSLISIGAGPDGLASAITDANGNSTTINYDSLGRMSGILPASGGAMSAVASGESVLLTSPGGTSSTLQNVALPGGGAQLLSIDADGPTSTTTVGADGSITVIHQDGTQVKTVPMPDPRYGMQASRSTTTVTSPAGLQTVVRSTASVTRDSAGQVILEVDSVVTNGLATVTTVDPSQRALTVQWPTGRRRMIRFDHTGQMTFDSLSGLLPTTLAYDSAGHLKSVVRGGLSWQYQYDLVGNANRRTDPDGKAWRFGVDADGRLRTLIAPGSDTTRVSYDNAGNVATFTTPRGNAHAFTYTNAGLLASYTPPDVGNGAPPYRYEYDSDGRLVRGIRQAGDTVAILFDASGRLTGRRTATDSVTIQRDSATGIGEVYRSSSGEQLDVDRDGSLATRFAWSGPVSGTVSFGYNPERRVATEAVNNTDTIGFSYDGEGRLLTAGQLILTRHPQTNSVAQSTLGGVVSTLSYDSRKAPTGIEVTFGSQTLYETTLTRDSSQRILGMTEVLLDTTRAWSFTYDSVGRLATVSLGGNVVHSYGYDRNGNRTSWASNNGTLVGSYDAQDRLILSGVAALSYTPDGDLAQRVSGSDTTTYTYSSTGQLLDLRLPNGSHVGYVYDPLGRLVGRKRDGVITKGLLYRNGVAPIAEVDGQGSLVSRFVYGLRYNVPEYMLRGGHTYRIVTDEVGSVRLVVDAQDGSVAQRVDYDPYGFVLLDTHPGFQPFGFAGGIYDDQSGLVHFGARDYDARDAHWTVRDPVLFEGGKTNLYAYSNSDPVNSSDPTGFYTVAELNATQEDNAVIENSLSSQIKQKLTTLRRTACNIAAKATRYSEKAMRILDNDNMPHNHHVLPEVLGGAETVPVYGIWHITDLHPLINVALKINGLGGLSSPMWESASEEQRRLAARAVLYASRAFDEVCSANDPTYQPIAPALEEILEAMGIPTD